MYLSYAKLRFLAQLWICLLSFLVYNVKKEKLLIVIETTFPQNSNEANVSNLRQDRHEKYFIIPARKLTALFIRKTHYKIQVGQKCTIDVY